jgi:hypothetical protein
MGSVSRYDIQRDLDYFLRDLAPDHPMSLRTFGTCSFASCRGELALRLAGECVHGDFIGDCELAACLSEASGLRSTPCPHDIQRDLDKDIQRYPDHDPMDDVTIPHRSTFTIPLDDVTIPHRRTAPSSSSTSPWQVPPPTPPTAAAAIREESEERRLAPREESEERRLARGHSPRDWPEARGSPWNTPPGTPPGTPPTQTTRLRSRGQAQIARLRSPWTGADRAAPHARSPAPTRSPEQIYWGRPRSLTELAQEARTQTFSDAEVEQRAAVDRLRLRRVHGRHC